MENLYTPIEHAQPAVPHERRGQKESLSSTGAVRFCKVIEVRPPANSRKARWTQHKAVEQEFFPLVSAAHEFKTPLVVMLGYTDPLDSGRLGAIHEKQREVLGEIQESAERLQALIQDLLLLCKLRADRDGGKADLLDAEANEQVGEIFNFWALGARQKSIEFKFQPSTGNPQVGVDALKLQHIVSNLIENALKYTPAGGRVMVTVTPCFWERRKTQTGFLFSASVQRYRDSVC